MKKSFLLFFLFSFLFSLGITFGYSSEDTSNANYLADQGIVTKQTTASKYRLDDKILRQEVIGMALKVKGITLPDNYTCKRYFADAIKNDWICRAVELAADNGIITRSNKYANPGKSVTRAEALAMVMSAGGLNPEDLPAGGVASTDATVLWQIRIIDAASKFGILDKDDYTTIKIDYSGEMMNDTQMVFSPNRLALRSEVFGFAKNIVFYQNTINVKLIYISENVQVSDPANGICDNLMVLTTRDTRIIKTPAILKSTLESLLDEKNDPESIEFGPWNLSGMYSLELQSVGIVNNIASIYLKHSEQTLAHATEDDLLARVNNLSGGMQFSKENLLCGIGSQITTLAKQFPTVQKVKVYINNLLISEM